MVDEPAWGEGHEHHAEEQNESGGELQADGYKPGGVGLGLELGAADIVGSAA